MTTDVRFTEIEDLMPAAGGLREIRHHIHHLSLIHI